MHTYMYNVCVCTHRYLFVCVCVYLYCWLTDTYLCVCVCVYLYCWLTPLSLEFKFWHPTDLTTQNLHLKIKRHIQNQIPDSLYICSSPFWRKVLPVCLISSNSNLTLSGHASLEWFLMFFLFSQIWHENLVDWYLNFIPCELGVSSPHSNSNHTVISPQ